MAEKKDQYFSNRMKENIQRQKELVNQKEEELHKLIDSKKSLVGIVKGPVMQQLKNEINKKQSELQRRRRTLVRKQDKLNQFSESKKQSVYRQIDFDNGKSTKSKLESARRTRRLQNQSKKSCSPAPRGDMSSSKLQSARKLRFEKVKGKRQSTFQKIEETYEELISELKMFKNNSIKLTKEQRSIRLTNSLFPKD